MENHKIVFLVVGIMIWFNVLSIKVKIDRQIELLERIEISLNK